MIVKLLKGIYNVRTPMAKYSETWDIDVLLRFIKKMKPVHKLSFKELTLKLIALLAITRQLG